MALKIRRGTDAQRSGVIFDQGEIVWTTDAQKLWVGDGITQGGVPVVGSSVVGYGLSFNNTTKRLELGTVYTDDITESPTAVKKFFTQELAQDAAALLFTTGIHTGVTVQYDDQNGRINLTVDPDDIGITDLVLDTTPQLGGNLDLNGNNITGVGDINNFGDIKLSGKFLSDLPPVSGPNPDRVSRPIEIGDATRPVTVKLISDQNLMVLRGLTDGTSTSSARFLMSRGTLSSKTALQPGDPTVFLEGFGWDGTADRFTGAIVVAVDPDATVGGGITPGAVGLIASDATGNPTTAIFNSKGVLNAPIFKATGYATGSLPLSPEEGWIVFDSTSKQFKGWNGSAWTVLG